MISEEQIKEIKNQLVSQIDKSFPEDRKEFAIKQIQEMNGEQLEEFLQQNNISLQGSEEGGQCIFCSIISGQIPSYKISENKEAIAVLDIRPASKGHSLIIPKEHVEGQGKMPKTALDLVKEVSKKIKSKLKAKEIRQESSSLFGHETINLIPVYEGEGPKALTSERDPASESDLAEMQKLLHIKPKVKVASKQPKTKKLKPEEILRLPRRIP